MLGGNLAYLANKRKNSSLLIHMYIFINHTLQTCYKYYFY